jgi:hypothetical protein
MWSPGIHNEYGQIFRASGNNTLAIRHVITYLPGFGGLEDRSLTLEFPANNCHNARISSTGPHEQFLSPGPLLLHYAVGKSRRQIAAVSLNPCKCERLWN